jgi:Domain of Unknown Function with PDB structure (DUF3857)
MTRKLSFSKPNDRGALRRILLLLLAALSPAVPGRAASLPEWLEAARHVDTTNFGQGSAAVVLDSRVDFSVDASGKFLWLERRVLKILNRRAAEPYLHVVAHENSNESVVAMQAWSIAPSGAIAQTDKKDIATRSSFAEFELFSDERYKTVAIPAVEDGSVVGVEIHREGHLTLQSERFALEESIPVWLSELHIAVPSGSLRTFVNFPDRVQVLSQSSNAATFRASQRPGIPDEEDMPPYWSVRGAVFANYDPKGSAAIQSWEEAGRFISPFFESAKQVSPDISAEVDRLAASAADLPAQLEALNGFVSRKIRYVAVEIGDGGFQPHAAADVYRYKYGDCKDKAMLLISMLAKIGVPAFPALVGTRGDIEAAPSAPTLISFDHMIVAVPVPESLRPAIQNWSAYDPGSQILWIDPTSDLHPVGELPEMDQGVYSLVAMPKRSVLLRIPEIAPEKNGREYTAELELDEAGQGTAEVQVKYLGESSALRHSYYRNQSQSEIRKGFEERLARYVNRPALQQVQVSGLEENRDAVVESFSFQGNFSTAGSGDNWFFQPLFLSGMESWEIGSKPRVHPLNTGAPYHIHGEYSIGVAPNMQIDRLPDPVSIETQFGSIHLSYVFVGHRLKATQDILFRLSEIPPDQYMAFRDFLNQVSRLQRQRLRVKPLE